MAKPLDLQPGVYPSQPYDEYDRVVGLRSSILRQHQVSARCAHFAELDSLDPETDDDSKALRIGRAFHTLVLEPDLFSPQFAVVPQGLDKRTKKGKALWAEFEEEHIGKTYLKQAEATAANAMAKAFFEHPATPMHLLPGRRELTIVDNVYFDGASFKLKVRLDAEYKSKIGDAAIVDLKSMNDDPTDRAISMSIWKYRYDVQAAMQMDLARKYLGSKDFDYYWCFVQSKPPYDVVWRRANEEALLQGDRDYKAWVRRHHECTLSEQWPGMDSQVNEIGLPQWAYDESLPTDPRMKAAAAGGGGADDV